MIHSFVQIFIKFIYDTFILTLWEKILLSLNFKNKILQKKKRIDYYPGNRKWSMNFSIFLSSIFLKIFRAIFFYILILIDPHVRVRNVFARHSITRPIDQWFPSIFPFINWKNRTIFGCLWSVVAGVATLFAIAPECLVRF